MNRKRRQWLGVAWLVFTVLLVSHPQATYSATHQALALWWQVVLPGLLPFLIASSLLGRLGMIALIGRWLEPLTRRLFNLPGTAALVIVLGYSSGPPVAAAMVAELRRRRLCTPREGERLLCFTHNASPLFLLAAVPVGMLGDASLGVPLAAAHYCANLILGLLWRRYGGARPTRQPQASPFPTRSVPGAVSAEPPMAALLGEAVTQAFRTLLLVAGYMTLAAVALALLRETGGLGPLARAFGALLALFSLPPSLGEAVAEGLVEMTLGTSRACQSSAPLGDRLTVASMILGWSGLSVHGQVASVLAGTDLRLGPYLLSRIAQGLLAAVLIRLWLPEAVPTFQLPRPATWSPLLVCELSLLLLGLGLALWLLLALLFALFRRSWYGGL